ncbi:hypothetical protein [Anaerotalea alkaliphila]|uniref:Uncharacterized protein n=1 Tax=Anaerotalea alkaliphila TaxID=2662126 RepID=A0A7X5KLR2_9FIRM|nr:hypothetical protein [Anaerotalea alkaliphila]NDL66964.1 hypothetical protein [Anaerotalea alkaliphila]
MEAGISIEEMMEDLTAYFEAAGYEDYFEKELRDKSKDEIVDLYRRIFLEEEPDSGIEL